MNLSICVIGRNEARNLPRIIESLSQVNSIPIEIETIYVDSASQDESAEIARKYFSMVVVLKSSAGLCAASGRNVGTYYAKGDWILYLDADMALKEDFVPFIIEVCSRKAEATGWVGRCDYIFDDGSMLTNVGSKRSKNSPAPNFGGAVLLPRAKVLEAGNWAAGVFSNEEFELYARLMDIGCTVLYADIKMIEHYTSRQPALRTLVSIYMPNGGLGKKYYGFGQVIAYRLRRRQLHSYIYRNPHPFVWSMFFVLSLLMLILGEYPISLVCILVGLLHAFKSRGIKGPVYLTAYMIQAIFGFSKYDKNYVPVVRDILTRVIN